MGGYEKRAPGKPNEVRVFRKLWKDRLLSVIACLGRDEQGKPIRQKPGTNDQTHADYPYRAKFYRGKLAIQFFSSVSEALALNLFPLSVFAPFASFSIRP